MPRTPGRYEIGLDLGATLVKAAFVPAGRPLRPFEPFVCSVRNRAALGRFFDAHPARRIAATGGGAARLKETWRATAEVLVIDEFVSWGAGEKILLADAEFVPSSPHLLVSLGTGTSILAVSADGSVSRIGGTALGGGTVRGLGRLLVGESSHGALVALARAGAEARFLPLGEFTGAVGALARAGQGVP